ncbi:MAG: hypothetical protein Q7S51_05165 [Gallionellaceae bacterium]|nr:hypothetical protein [Gallionellaceae bacterium]
MNAQKPYTHEPINDIRAAADILPTPDDLAYREDSIKITITLSRKSVEFFKDEATKRQTQYQRMIRRLLDSYVDAQSS